MGGSTTDKWSFEEKKDSLVLKCSRLLPQPSPRRLPCLRALASAVAVTARCDGVAARREWRGGDGWAGPLITRDVDYNRVSFV